MNASTPKDPGIPSGPCDPVNPIPVEPVNPIPVEPVNPRSP